MAIGSFAPLHSKHADMTSGDQSFEKFFEEVIASPELNLLDDVFSEEIDEKPDIHHPHYPHMPHPILHRLQPVPPPPLSILKAHVLPIHHHNPTTPPSSGSGGISPTLTWSGGPSPVDHDNDSPTLNDAADIDGEEWKPSSVPSLFPSADSRRNSAGSRGRERVNVANAVVGGSDGRNGTTSHSRSRSTQRSMSASTSADGGDELTMSALSIQNGTTSLALISSPPSPGGGTAHTPRPGSSPGPRKKSRTTSSSRSSISSIDALISEAMGSGPANRLIPTGHRRNITSASLVPLDAPTQIRNYLTPSSTSKKDIPSAFVARKNKLRARESSASPGKGGAASSSSQTAGRKRTREEAGLKMESTDEHVDELQDDDTPLDGGASSPSSPVAYTPGGPSSSSAAAGAPEVASESSSLLSAIEAKRRQNTLAARRSRQRKLDYVRNLEELVAALTKERDSWKGRAESAEKVLGYVPGEDDMDEDDDDE